MLSFYLPADMHHRVIMVFGTPSMQGPKTCTLRHSPLFLLSFCIGRIGVIHRINYCIFCFCSSNRSLLKEDDSVYLWPLFKPHGYFQAHDHLRKAEAISEEWHFCKHGFTDLKKAKLSKSYSITVYNLHKQISRPRVSHQTPCTFRTPKPKTKSPLPNPCLRVLRWTDKCRFRVLRWEPTKRVWGILHKELSNPN